ncbi:hypothetical protein KSP39_PZI005998 [Platanthera zijinensis]|uniref:Uncharacterized protein n=1 Tax=Platanthera zijinensis TaxID=2320716 RepID=A0AAP0GB88_9ASPA
MGILFGEGIRCFGRDWFDGSKEERQIYMEVLYAKSRGNLNHASSKKMNDDCLRKQSGDVNAKTSVYTIYSPLIVPTSVSETSKPQFHIVESFSHGLLSSLSFDTFPVLWSSQAKVLQSHCGCYQLRKKYKEFNALVLMQTSSMNCAFPYFNALALHLQQSTKSHVFESDMVDLHANTPASSEAFSTKDLTVGLRSYALHFLEDADWKVQVRGRKSPRKDGLGKMKLDYYFLSPEGRMLHSLSKAWVACGSMLR